MEENLGAESTSKQGASTHTDNASKKSEKDTHALDELMSIVLDLPYEKYGGDWHPEEIRAMHRVLTGGRGKFPKKVLPYVELFRKYLFQTGQLVALAAAAHHHAMARSEEKENLIKPATFKEVAALEANRETSKNKGKIIL